MNSKQQINAETSGDVTDNLSLNNIMKKVIVEVKVKLVINQNDDVETSKIIDELEYEFTDTTGKADIVDTTIEDYEVVDSK